MLGGSLYLGINAVAVGSQYNNKMFLIGNSVSGKEINWVNVNGLLIADRCILTNINWNQLFEFVKGKMITIDKMDFRCRLLKVGDADGVPNEWDAALDATNGSNELWYWKDMYFWGQETINESRHIMRGYSSACYRAYCNGYINSTEIGFRPALEPKNPEALNSKYLLTMKSFPSFAVAHQIQQMRTELLFQIKSRQLTFLDLCCQYAHTSNIAEKEAMAQIIYQIENKIL